MVLFLIAKSPRDQNWGWKTFNADANLEICISVKGGRVFPSNSSAVGHMISGQGKLFVGTLVCGHHTGEYKGAERFKPYVNDCRIMTKSNRKQRQTGGVTFSCVHSIRVQQIFPFVFPDDKKISMQFDSPGLHASADKISPCILPVLTASLPCCRMQARLLDATGADEETAKNFEEAFGPLEDRLVEHLNANPRIFDEAIAAVTGAFSSVFVQSFRVQIDRFWLDSKVVLHA